VIPSEMLAVARVIGLGVVLAVAVGVCCIGVAMTVAAALDLVATWGWL